MATPRTEPGLQILWPSPGLQGARHAAARCGARRRAVATLRLRQGGGAARGKPLIAHVIDRLRPQVGSARRRRPRPSRRCVAARPAASRAGSARGACAAALAYAAANGFDAVADERLRSARPAARPRRPRSGAAPAVVLGQPLLGLWPRAGGAARRSPRVGHRPLAARLGRGARRARDRSWSFVNINIAQRLAARLAVATRRAEPVSAGRFVAYDIPRSDDHGDRPIRTVRTTTARSARGVAVGFGLGLAATAGRKAAVQAITVAAGDWFEGLKAEHKMAMGIIELLEKTSEAEPKKRAALLLSLQHALGKHAMQEEDVIYCALRALGDVTDADKLGSEHNAQVKQGLYDLEQIDKTSPAWLGRLAQLKADIEHMSARRRTSSSRACATSCRPTENRKLTNRMNREGFKVA